jgi:hypothetical protein
VLNHRGHKPEYRWHLVTHPQAGKQTIPLATDYHAKRIGVILGNGPQIDTLGADFFAKIRSPWYVSVGVNRICCSQTCIEHDFAPDLHLIWDSGNRGNPLHEAQRKGCERLAGRSWRMISSEPDARVYPHDQILERENLYEGSPRGVKMTNVSTDAAINALYREGVREFYLYGIEMNDSAHCKVAGIDESKFDAPWMTEEQLALGLDAWRDAMKGMPDAKFFCASETSKLVTSGVMEFRAIDLSRNYE